METLYCVMEMDGPYNWRKAEFVTGPYYDEKDWFGGNPYKSKDDAKIAIKDVLDECTYSGPFFIIEAYQ